MPAVEVAITSPVTGSTVGTSFTVSGNCELKHVVTVKIVGTSFSNQATPLANGDWSTNFTNVPASTYSITATCGTPQSTTTINNIKVT